jgi:hypothetical protein
MARKRIGLGQIKDVLRLSDRRGLFRLRFKRFRSRLSRRILNGKGEVLRTCDHRRVGIERNILDERCTVDLTKPHRILKCLIASGASFHIIGLSETTYYGAWLASG